MDRIRANATIRTALLTAAFAAFLFGLTFFAAIVY